MIKLEKIPSTVNGVPSVDGKFTHRGPRACERPIRTCTVFLDRVQNLHIHAVRAKFYLLFVRLLGITQDSDPLLSPGTQVQGGIYINTI